MSTVVVINSLPSLAGAWRGILVIPGFGKEKQEGGAEEHVQPGLHIEALS